MPALRAMSGRRSARLAVVLAVCVSLIAVAAAAGAATNTISTVAGTGVPGNFGDGGPATGARLNVPTEVTATADGGFLISDQGNSSIRRVLPDGRITRIAGNLTPGFSGDNGPATAAQLSAPNGVTAMPDGSVLIADSNNNRVRRVSPGGTITTVAGTGAAGYNGDGIPATTAQLAFPAGLAATPDGGYLIADNDNHRIRKVSAGGVISTVAGTGAPGFSGDNGPAPGAQLNSPAGVAVMPSGGFLFSETANQRVRRVSPTGTITTVAGTGAPGFSGDGGPATAAALNSPNDVAATIDGGYLIADATNNRVRKVSAAGTITTAAGNGLAGFTGDGVLATATRLSTPLGVSVTTGGDYLIADTNSHRIRAVDAVEPLAVTPPPLRQPLPKPVLGRRVNVQLVRGRVLIAVPARTTGSQRARASQKGLRFVPLREDRQIPIGSFLDTKRGTVRLVTATQRAGVTQSGEFSQGLFQVLQSRRRSSKGIVEVRLKGSNFRRCRLPSRSASASGPQADTAARRRYRRTVRRRVRGNARGRFRTRGRYSAATVRGTIWTVSDRCDGTLTKVSRGRVAVRDLRRKRTISVRRGKSYLARAPG